MNWHLAFDPLLPIWLITALGLFAALPALVGLFRRAPGSIGRLGVTLFAALTLLGPTMVEEERQSLKDVAILVTDNSASMAIGTRRSQSVEAAAALSKKMTAMPDLDVRTIDAGSSDDGTKLFDSLARALADVPQDRLAGAVLLSDGQVHDVPADIKRLMGSAPLHSLIAGSRGEQDRRLEVIEAPRFGIVGEAMTMTVKVEDGTATGAIDVAVSVDGSDRGTFQVEPGKPRTVPLILEHGGANVIELAVAPGSQELTLENNRAVIVATGIRDRLRVLLVSGEPHPGERTWRNLLKADPAVDLVHFTILRPPEKQDGTPINELALIAFPTRELFVEKLDQFDLVIFDRYRWRGVLPNAYLENIARYVERGGALLAVAGPSYASALSLYRTPLSAVLPGRPTGDLIERPYRPMLTDLGRRHPVTADLPGAGEPGQEASWGRFLRLVDTSADTGETVMTGADGKPLLVLQRIGEGRIAQLMSDQVWLWARGFEGGGPQGELLRRIAHWLMKEPDLDEEALTAVAQGGTITVIRRSLQENLPPVEVTAPGGAQSNLSLSAQGSGRWQGRITQATAGVWRFRQGDFTTVAVSGSTNPREFSDVRASEKLLAPLAEVSGGAVRWLADGGPEVRRVSPTAAARGKDWIGFRQNNQTLVTALTTISLIPPALALLVLLGGLILTWRRESR